MSHSLFPVLLGIPRESEDSTIDYAISAKRGFRHC